MIPLNHTGTAGQTALAGSIDNAATIFTLLAAPPAGAWPLPEFIITVDRNSPNEEKMLVTDVSVDRSTLTVIRGFDGTAAVPHVSDAIVEHTISAAEMQWLSDHINSNTGHLLSSPIVGTDDYQTLTNKVIDDTSNDISITTNSILNYEQIVNERNVDFVARNQPRAGDQRSPNEAGVPTGTVVLWAGPTQGRPVGWLLCDGSTLVQANYPELYWVLGSAFTPAPNAETFNLPDMRSYEPPNMRYYVFDGIGGP